MLLLAVLVLCPKTLLATVYQMMMIPNSRRLQNPCDQDSLLERAMMTGWKCYEEGVRDIGELLAAAMEAIEGDVTDHDMCMDLIQTIQEVFDQAVFPED